MENTISEMKDSLDGLISRVDITEESISVLEDSNRHLNCSTEKTMTGQNTQGSTINWSLRRERVRKTKFEEIMAEIFSNFMRTTIVWI